MATIGMKILVEKDMRSAIDQIEAALKEKGLRNVESIPEFRTIMASGDSSLMQQVRNIQGVEGVRLEAGFQLPPMDEKVPQ